MAELILQTNTSRPRGSRASRRIRRDGQIPGVVYGMGGDSVPVVVNARELRAALTTDAGLNALLTLDIDGEHQLSLVKELQHHPVRNEVIHVDFIRIAADLEVEVDVRLVLVGEAASISSEGGTVDQAMFSVRVLAKPQAIPNELEVDVSELTLGDSLRAEDIALPAGVTLAVDPDELVAGTSAQAVMEEEVTEEEDEELAEGDETESDDAAADSSD